jgi:hypothetical protein
MKKAEGGSKNKIHSCFCSSFRLCLIFRKAILN